MRPSRAVVVSSLVALAATLALSAAPVVAQEDVTLSITVVDRNGQPVGGVDLSATWDGGGPVNETTRASGQALIDVPAGADVEVTVHDDTYVRNRPYAVADAAAGDVEIPVALRGEATVSVTSPGGPVSDATVRLVDDVGEVASARTDDGGDVTIEPVERAAYDVEVEKPGYVRNGTRLRVQGQSETTVAIERGTVQLSVTVEDDRFDPPEPVENATVRIAPTGASLPTLPDGTATTAVPVNRDYELEVTKDGYETATADLRVREWATETTVSINRADDVSISASNDRVVVGETTRVTVTDEYGDPIEGATVSRDGESVGETDADGRTRVRIEADGTATITASADGMEASVIVEGVTPGGTETETETEGGSTPGFGPVAAALALCLAAGLLVRRS